jgi:hypothetical protein
MAHGDAAVETAVADEAVLPAIARCTTRKNGTPELDGTVCDDVAAGSQPNTAVGGPQHLMTPICALLGRV